MLTTSWFEGYVGLDDYTTHYYENLSPFQLGWLCQLCGFQGPSVDRPFTYVDICSGRGVSLVLHAANFPNGRFYGVDLSSSHVAQSRELARRAGVTNVEFFEAAVNDLETLDLPTMDFAVIQGAYSWLSKRNQQSIRDFLEKQLKPGGIFQIHYISYPGSLRSEPLLRMIYDYSRHETGAPSERLGKAIDKLKKFSQVKMGVFSDPEGLKKQLDQRFNQDLRYLAHDFLSRDRRGHFFTDMAHEMREARMEYVCSNVPYRNLSLESFSKSAPELYSYMPEQDQTEMLKDFYMGESVRRDIYQRGRISLAGQGQIDELQRMQFVRMTSLENIKSEIKTQAFSMNMPQKHIDIMKSVMEKRRFTGSDLIKAFTEAALKENLQPNAYLGGLGTTIMLFYMVNYLRPLLPEKLVKASRRSCNQLNKMALQLSPTDNSLGAMVSPVLGAGVMINPIERLVLSILEANKGDPTNLKENVISQVRRMGMRININTPPSPEDGAKGMEDMAEAAATMAEEMADAMADDSKVESLTGSQTIATSADEDIPVADASAMTSGADSAGSTPQDQDEVLGKFVDEFLKNRIALYRDLELLAS